MAGSSDRPAANNRLGRSCSGDPGCGDPGPGGPGPWGSWARGSWARGSWARGSWARADPGRADPPGDARSGRRSTRRRADPGRGVLAAAVGRVVAHRWYSWFCGQRLLGWSGRGFLGAGGGGCSDIGVDDTARADLAGVQRRRLLESDDHITIRLPPLITDVTREMFGKCVRREIRIGEHLLVVGLAEGDDIFVWCQAMAAPQCAHSVGGLAAQRVLDLLRGRSLRRRPGRRHRSTVDSELALEPFHQTHVTAYLRIACARGRPPRVAPPCCFTCMVSGGGTHVAPRVTLRIALQQVRRVILGTSPHRSAGARFVIGCGLRDSAAAVVLGEWRNGRRAGFRCQCPSGRGGSSPPSPTKSGSMNCRHKGHEPFGFVAFVFCWPVFYPAVFGGPG